MGKAVLSDPSGGMYASRQCVGRGRIGEPKTEKSKAAVLVVPQLAKKLAEFPID